jgi:hypothetical protein
VRVADEVHVVHEATASACLGEEPERAMRAKAVHEVGVRARRVRAHLHILFGAISLTVPFLCWAGEREVSSCLLSCGTLVDRCGFTVYTLHDGTLVRKGWTDTYSTYAMGRLEAIWGDDCMEYMSE